MCLHVLYPLLVNNASFEVRLAAGELAALLFEGRGKSGLKIGDASAPVVSSKGEEEDDGEDKDYYIPATLEELLASFPRIIYNLSKENSRHTARKEKVR